MKTNKNISIDTELSAKVTGEIPHGAFSALVESLLRYWLAQKPHGRKILEARSIQTTPGRSVGGGKP